LAIIARGEGYFLAASDADNCAICGRALTDPASRYSGVGPECINLLFKRHRFRADEVLVRETREGLEARIREIRLQMKAEHPDHGGSGDGALFAKLSGELKALRAKLNAGVKP
jgi:hypothetical protein